MNTIARRGFAHPGILAQDTRTILSVRSLRKETDLDPAEGMVAAGRRDCEDGGHSVLRVVKAIVCALAVVSASLQDKGNSFMVRLDRPGSKSFEHVLSAHGLSAQSGGLRAARRVGTRASAYAQMRELLGIFADKET